MKTLDNLTQKKIFVYIFFAFALGSALVSFIYKVNLSNLLGLMELSPFLIQFDIYTRNGGVVSDLATHWEYIQIIKEDIKNLILLTMGEDVRLLHFPIHHIIISQIYILSENIKTYLNIYFLFSLFLPYIFYLCLKEQFQKINILVLFKFAIIIYLFPAFQYSAIWGNSHITSLFFFLISIFFHIKFKNGDYKKLKYFFYSIISLSLAAYTKQYYVFFFIFIFIEFFFNLKLRLFLYLSFFTFLLSLPGLFFLYKNPLLFFGIKQDVTNFASSILLSSSICFVYILPFLIQYLINSKILIKKEINKFIDKKYLILTIIIFLLCVPFFSYNSNVGGGIFYKLFYEVLNLKYLFFLISLIGIYFLFYFTKKNISSYILTFLILCTFSTGYFIFQKYFEPMFFIIFLIYFDKEKIKLCIFKNNYISILYFLTYYLSSNYIYFFGI